MLSYLIKRLILLFVTLWGITIVSFLMLQLAPGSPLEMRMQRGRGGELSDKSALTDELREQLKKQYHLDKPIFVRYGLWIKDLARLNFGRSITDHRPVIDKIKERLPVSLALGLSSVFFALLVGIPLGILSAAFRNSWVDHSTSIVVIALYSLPSYVLGILLLTFFGGGEFLNWFPIYGIQSDDYETLSFWGKILDRIHHFVLPCLCYSIGIAFITLQQRASLIEAMSQDFIRTARAKGLSEPVIYLKHAFRNSLIPIVTILGAMVPSILGGAVIIESLFSIPGLGELAFKALLERDYPVIMANFTAIAFLSLLGILVSDILYMIVDPRINFEAQT